MNDQIVLHFSHYELILQVYKNSVYYETYSFQFAEYPDKTSILKKMDQIVTPEHCRFWDVRVEQYASDFVPFAGVFTTLYQVYKEPGHSENAYKKCVQAVFHFPTGLYHSLPSIRLKKMLEKRQ